MTIRNDGGARGPLTERRPPTISESCGNPRPALVTGAGAVVTDEAGREYLDMTGGIAANVLGHAHPAVVAAVFTHAAGLGHVADSYVADSSVVGPTVLLGRLLLALAGAERVLFTHSGAEAHRAALRVARLTGRSHVVAAAGALRGRYPASRPPTGQPAKAVPFRVPTDDVKTVPFGEVQPLRTAVSGETAMVILQPIHGENDVIVPPPGYLAAAREICTSAGALLAFDEVGIGLGRTGYWFHHQSEGVEPDLITLAGELGGGLPLGACLALGPAAGLLTPGVHATTAGGSPVSCAAGLAVIRTIAGQGLLDHVRRVGDRLRRGIEALHHPLIARVRGAGLLLGLLLAEPVAAPVTDRLRVGGFLVEAIQPTVIRLAPPLILTAAQADAFVAALPRALDPSPAATAPPRLLRDAT